MKNHRLITLAILIIGIYIVISLLRSNIQLWQQGKTIEQAKQRNEKLKKENESLKQVLSWVESEEFIEKEARNKLNMGKPGEVVVIIPDSLVTTSSASQSNHPLYNWEKWKRLFE